jgi:TetR/AcrR family transcriptional repressor of lmrAB and yxaGH operons
MAGDAKTGDSKARMVSAAERLFRIQGLHATGLAEVLEQSGAPRGSLYHYFPGGKDELAAEAIRTAAARIGAAIRALFEASESVPAALRAYGVRASARLQATDYREGCPVGNTVLEASTLSPSVRAVCDEGLRSWEAVIAGALVAEGAERADAERFGTFAVATFEGALLVARGRQTTAPMDDAAERLASFAEALLRR